MADWTLTATTIYCDATDYEVTLIVQGDGTLQCTGYAKYGKPSKETAKLFGIKGKQLGKELGCEGLDCQRIARYRDRLFAGKARSGESADRE